MDEYWRIKFGIEVSARYHDWRRSTLGQYVTSVRAISLAGSGLALVVVFAELPSFASIPVIVAIATSIVAIVNLFDLVFGFDELARKHTDLYKRFKQLQMKIAKDQSNWPEQIAEWESEAQAIRVDEPPTYWALYAVCWNQTIERHETDGAYSRKVTRAQYLLRNLKHFRPRDFPTAFETDARLAS